MNYLFVILVLANFLRTVGIIVITYYVLKFVGRLLFPIIVKKAVNNMQARQSTYTHAQRKAEGEVTIEKKQGQQGRHQNTEGEYVDFEEVD
ncbi:MAG TPA: DUF4834 domain-containing protein [Prolixibacteraceae bacterium]|jgi:hypothetical protein|nr:DUF4834 domain-containing protein [Prolixibacteraceae bacterium]